ncbi:hypothetical protein [Rhodophyticola sp.]|jgi:nicotinamide riboside transporter PnuC|uniref:hypothetical protein n=1 Tax=Rhodophyticola sp. TaxID=2680032 RepID=UPI003D2A3B44
MQDMVQWFATLTGIAAAVIVSLNLGRKLTGYGFIVFTASSIAWVCFALQAGETPLAIQNVVLTVINIVGIYRWLILKGQTNNAEA